MKAIKELRAEAVLNKKIRFEEGIMTRLEWLKLKMTQGCRVELSTKPRVKYNRIKFNRMESYAEQQKYERKCNEMIPNYRLYENNSTSFWEITKIEYEKFQDMQLVFDLNTEKHALQNGIEAGTATPEEIEKDMQKDIDEMNKYYIEDKNPYEPPTH